MMSSDGAPRAKVMGEGSTRATITDEAASLRAREKPSDDERRIDLSDGSGQFPNPAQPRVCERPRGRPRGLRACPRPREPGAPRPVPATPDARRPHGAGAADRRVQPRLAPGTGHRAGRIEPRPGRSLGARAGAGRAAAPTRARLVRAPRAGGGSTV